MGVPCHQSCPGVSEGLWHDAKRPESFWARQDCPWGTEGGAWCLSLGNCTQRRLEPSKAGVCSNCQA